MSGPLPNVSMGGAEPPFNTSSVAQSAWLNGSSHYLSKTPQSGNPTRFIVGGWFQFIEFGTDRTLFCASPNSGSGQTDFFRLYSTTSDTLRIDFHSSGYETDVRLRDAGWYHIVFSFETGLGGTLYVNGTEEPLTQVLQAWPSSLGWNGPHEHRIGGPTPGYGGQRFFDGYMAQVFHFDGQSFQNGDVHISDVGRSYSRDGSFFWWVAEPDSNLVALATAAGGNSFCLTDVIGDGVDASANGNGFSANALTHVANGSFNTPSNVHCHLNPLDKGAGGNVSSGGTGASIIVGSVGDLSIASTMWLESGKWYWELADPDGGGGFFTCHGVLSQRADRTTYVGGDAFGWGWAGNGTKRNGNSSAYASGFTQGETLMIALDMNVGAIWFGKNGTWLNGADREQIASGNTTNAAFVNITGPVTPAVSSVNLNANIRVQFESARLAHVGQIPTGFSIVSSANFASPKYQGRNYFDALPYPGTDLDTRLHGGPPIVDLAWVKATTFSLRNFLSCRVRGETTSLDSAATNVEDLAGVLSFTEGGIDVPSGMAALGVTYIAWLFREGAHFSVFTYLGTAAQQSVRQVPHPLGAVPELIIVKNTGDNSGLPDGWAVYHKDVPVTQHLRLDTNAAAFTSQIVWENTPPTSTHFTVGIETIVNREGDTLVAYLFRSVEGLCKVGSYVGNGNAEGPYVYCGFRPRWLMIKCRSHTGSWIIVDTARSPINPTTSALFADLPSAESVSSAYAVDMLSDGFKLRTSDSNTNANGRDYVFLAIADSAGGGVVPPVPGRARSDHDAVVGSVPPFFVTNPIITGIAEIGETLTHVSGTYDGTELITQSHEWVDDNGSLLQSGGSTYVIQPSDYSRTIRIRETLLGPSASTSEFSAPTQPLPAVSPSFQGTRPTVTTNGKVGGSLAVTEATGVSGIPVPVNDVPAFTVRDVTDLGNLVSEDAAAYQWQPGDVGKTFVVRQHVANPGGVAHSDSLQIGPIAFADTSPSNAAAPSISPMAVTAGGMLTCDPGQWSGNPTPTLSFQWTNDGTDILGQTSSTYTTLNPGDIGGLISCRVTADNGVAPSNSAASTNTIQPTPPIGGSFHPSDLTGSVWMIDPQVTASVTMDASNNIAQIDDQIGAHHAVQSDPAHQPVYSSNAINSLPGFVCDGSQNMTIGSMSFTTDPYSFIGLVDSSNASGFSDLFGVSKFRAFMSGSIGVRVNGTNHPLQPSGQKLYIGMVTFGSNWEVFIDGVSVSTGTGTLWTAGSSGGSLFSRFLGNFQVNSNYGPLILHQGTLVTADRQKLEGWLAHQYNATSLLSQDHPYKTVAP